MSLRLASANRDPSINRIPQEILLEIFKWVRRDELLSNREREGRQLLKCAVVRISWLGPARTVHFRNVALQTGDGEQPHETLKRFCQTVDPIHGQRWGLAEMVRHIDLLVTDIREGDKRKWYSLKPGLDEKAVNAWTGAISHLPNLGEISLKSVYWAQRLTPYLRAITSSPSILAGKLRRLRLYSSGDARIMGCVPLDLFFLATLEELIIDSFVESVGRLLLTNCRGQTWQQPLFPRLKILVLEGPAIEDQNFRDLVSSTSDELRELSIVNTLVSAGCLLDLLKNRRITALTLQQNEEAAPTLLETEAFAVLQSEADPSLIRRAALFPLDAIISRMPTLTYLSITGPGFSGNILHFLPRTLIVLDLTDSSHISRYDVFDFLADGSHLPALKILRIDISRNPLHVSWQDQVWIESLENEDSRGIRDTKSQEENVSVLKSFNLAEEFANEVQASLEDIRVIALERATQGGPLGSQLQEVSFKLAR